MQESARGLAGIRRDREVEKVWKDIGGDQHEILSKCGGTVYKTRSIDIMKTKGKKTPQDIRGVEGGTKDKTYLHDPMDAKKFELLFLMEGVRYDRY